MGPMDNLFDGNDANLIPTAKSVLSAEGLLPCPFCGKAGPVELVDADTFRCLLPFDDEASSPPLYWAVFCDAGTPGGKGGCGASGGFAATKEGAVKRWNTRTPNVDSSGVLLAAAKELDRQQAKIDALMLEYCPDEMTEVQKANWARNQRPASEENDG